MGNLLRYQADSRLPAASDGSRPCDLGRSFEAVTRDVTSCGTRDLLAAPEEQTVVVPGSAAAEKVLPRLATSLAQVLTQRRPIAAEVEGIIDAHPLAEVLTSMPGIGVRTAARILLEVGDGSAFPTSGHLAAYAGLAP